MNSKPSEALPVSTEDLILSVIERGARLRLNDGQLDYKAPVGAVTSEQIRRLQGSRYQILKTLGEISTCPDMIPTSNVRLDFAPLASSQLIHWNLHKLGIRKSMRDGASALRLTGFLEISALRSAVEMIIERHEALRTNIGNIGDSPVQIIFASVRSEVRLYDLTAIPRSAREGELDRIFWKHAFEPIDVARDPLFSTIIVKMAHDEHVLIAAMDHMISDGMSSAILLRDIIEQYESEISHRRPSFPRISVQFADYAGWQRRMYELSADKRNHYWSDHISGCPALTSASDEAFDSSVRSGITFVPIHIDSELRKELFQWSQAKRTTVVMSVFTAFVALVLRWYEASEGVIQYQTAGRSMVEVQNTIGYFAFRMYMRLCIHAGDSFVDLMDRVKAEYVAACEHAECSSMDVYDRTPEVTRSPCFNWLPKGQIGNELQCFEKTRGLRCSRIPFEYQLTHLDDYKTDTDLMVGFCEAGDEIRGCVQFATGTMSLDSAEQFARNLVVFVRALLGQSEEQVTRIGFVP